MSAVDGRPALAGCALAALLSAACGGAGPEPRAGGDPRAYEQVILGELALENGDAAAAAAHFEAALAIDPHDPYLKERLAAARALGKRARSPRPYAPRAIAARRRRVSPSGENSAASWRRNAAIASARSIARSVSRLVPFR